LAVLMVEKMVRLMVVLMVVTTVAELEPLMVG
jgi:hypothetical protein